MKSNKFAFLLGMVGLAILTCIILWIIAIIGSMDLTDGCLYRYNKNKESNGKSDVVSNTVALKATANYTGSTESLSYANGSRVVLDPNSYGKWLNTNLRVKPEQKVDFTIKGEVSLCKAYIPKNNLQQDSDLDVKGNRVEIPRVEDKSTPPVSLILDAKTPNWKNLTELYRGDRFYVALHSEKKTPATSTPIKDAFTGNMRTADCTEGKTTYNPICGRYSLWNVSNGSYVSSCKFDAYCTKTITGRVCKNGNVADWMIVQTNAGCIVAMGEWGRYILLECVLSQCS